MRNHVFFLCASSLLVSACVTTGTYDKKVAELQKVTADHDQAATEREKTLQARIDDLQKKMGDLEKQLNATVTERDGLRRSLDDTTALAGEMKKRLEKLGQNVDKLTGEKSELARSLEELRKQKAAAEARAATFRNLVARLKSMIDAGQLKVIIRDGRMVIQLESDVLFDSGKTNIKPDGQTALAKLAPVLAGITDRKYLVTGFTDDVPIHTQRFPSNWELSTARAVEVVKFLVASGLKPQQVAAAGYSEFDPVVANDTPEHRAQNRRIEIVLQPNLSDLPSLDNLQSVAK
jgi:chemotaxis protein MotB